MMRLNPDCVRDILFVVEELTDGIKGVQFNPNTTPNYKRLSKYSHESIIYHLIQCEYGGYLGVTTRDFDDNMCVFGLSPKGHEFIEEIRADNIWNTIKNRSEQIGIFTLNALSQITATVVSELISGRLQL